MTFFRSLVMLAVCITTSEMHVMAQAQTPPSTNLDAIIANAQAAHDNKALTRATNLKWALGNLRPSELNGIKCGTESRKLQLDVPAAEDLTGKLLEKALERYLPVLAAAIASAPAAAVAAFLTPTPIGTDAVEILNQSDTRPRRDVEAAAREMLQDTTPDNFKKNISRQFTAKIVACSI
jgi:hypothetical protein